ncbi:unnamed protein product [Gongylonema pulchrum]|uniref:Phosphoglycerate mutase family protein n=1 Tax=Gongylonema pulchrum TaxID=637853 RepID=A0A183EY31_9BILA|nr:unnamed protein product [Gongylonema pulchrum]
MVKIKNTRANRTIWVVRHGQRIDNLKPEWKESAPRGAWDDPTLSNRGIVQARECGVRLSTEQIDAVYCSPFIRCIQTTEQIVNKYPKQLKVFIEPGICEALCSTQYPPGYLSVHELK